MSICLTVERCESLYKLFHVEHIVDGKKLEAGNRKEKEKGANKNQDGSVLI